MDPLTLDPEFIFRQEVRGDERCSNYNHVYKLSRVSLTDCH